MLNDNNRDFVRLADYIYLNRILNLKGSRLSRLFQDLEMSISKISTIERSSLIKLLIPNTNLKAYELIDKLYNFDFNSEGYKIIVEMLKISKDKGIKVYSPLDKQIPKLFERIPSVVEDVVFVKGIILDSDVKSYSICGTREPTKDAILKTQQIAQKFAKQGFTLINGFAKGIDSEAFKSQIKNKGRYIGVLGSGLENVYPPENKPYVDEIIENGAFISQRSVNERVDQQSLRNRNKLTAELPIGSIFIEGTYKSGTLWQYKYSKAANRLNFYLEPKNRDHDNSYICKMIKEDGGIQINNDLSNIEEIIDLCHSKADLKEG